MSLNLTQLDSLLFAEKNRLDTLCEFQAVYQLAKRANELGFWVHNSRNRREVCQILDCAEITFKITLKQLLLKGILFKEKRAVYGFRKNLLRSKFTGIDGVEQRYSGKGLRANIEESLLAGTRPLTPQESFRYVAGTEEQEAHAKWLRESRLGLNEEPATYRPNSYLAGVDPVDGFTAKDVAVVRTGLSPNGNLIVFTDGK